MKNSLSVIYSFEYPFHRSFKAMKNFIVYSFQVLPTELKSLTVEIQPVSIKKQDLLRRVREIRIVGLLNLGRDASNT